VRRRWRPRAAHAHQAIRASETLYKAGDKSFAADYKRLTADPSVDVVIQAMLTMNRWKVAGAPDDQGPGRYEQGARRPARRERRHESGRGRCGDAVAADAWRGGLHAEEQNLIERGGQIYRELCFTCHGDDGLGAQKPGTLGTMAPALAGSPRVNGHRDYIIQDRAVRIDRAGR
jgi:hypothetical protein